MKKILILSNHDNYLYNFRKELIERLLSDGYRVHISCPYGVRIEDLILMGCGYTDVELNRHGINIIEELKLLFHYVGLMEEIKPDVVLTYTIKPNIYGGIASRFLNTPYIANITGLGTAVENKGLMSRISIILYKIAFKKISCVFFQNSENLQFFINNKIVPGKYKLIPGSGVNLNHFQPLEYPDDKAVEFVFISRVMKAKGIEQYLEAARFIKKKYQNVIFHICGFCEEKYGDELSKLQSEGIVEYHGMLHDVREIFKKIHCTVLPTYYPEGISNVLLESAACGRPIITTNRAGCREVVDDLVNGYIIRKLDSKDLINKIEMFINLSHENKKQMGLKGREKIEKIFDRNIVVNSYLAEIENLIYKH